MGDTKFKAGAARAPTAGRKAGTPNKKTKEFMLMLEEKGFDPGEAYVELYHKQMELFDLRRSKNPKNVSGAAEILSDAGVSLNNICQYVYPKKKAIEHSGEVGVKTFADFMAAAKGKK